MQLPPRRGKQVKQSLKSVSHAESSEAARNRFQAYSLRSNIFFAQCFIGEVACGIAFERPSQRSDDAACDGSNSYALSLQSFAFKCRRCQVVTDHGCAWRQTSRKVTTKIIPELAQD
jgi:hypothetical protein